MANERMFLVHSPSGAYIYLGKRMGWGWYDTPDNIKDRIGKLFEMVENQEADGCQDDFSIAFDGDERLRFPVMGNTRCTTSNEPSKDAMKYEDVQIGDVVEYKGEKGTVIGVTDDILFLLHGIYGWGHRGETSRIAVGSPVKGSNLHALASAHQLTLIRRAFDFSQPRWQADCRELSKDECKSFLEALEKAFPKLRLPSPIWAKDLYFHRVTDASGLLSSYCANGDCNPAETATADDVRAFIARTLSVRPAEPTSEAASETHDEISTTLAQRGERYGEFPDFASISQRLKGAAHSAPKWHAIPADCREAVDMILHKIARVLNGDPNYADNWHDIQGYAKLVETRITKSAK